MAMAVLALAILGGCAAQSQKVAEPTFTPLSKRKITAVAFTNAAPEEVQQPAPLNQPAPISNSNQSQIAPATPANAPAPTPPPRARVVPMTARIASVNDKLRFVIVDFTNSRQPSVDEKLGVYRVGEKVAEIKISGPYRNTTVAADIVSGEVKYGDEVKTD
jgi:hypothetical protein